MRSLSRIVLSTTLLLCMRHFPAAAAASQFSDKPFRQIPEQTVSPAAANTTNSSSSPSTAPSVSPRVPLDGYITLELIDTPSLMEENLQGIFIDISEAFLNFQLFIGSPAMSVDGNQTYTSPLLDEEGVTVTLLRQSRSLLTDEGAGARHSLRGLQIASSSSTLRPLYVTLQVTVVAREPSVITVLDTELEDLDAFDDQQMELSSLEDFDLDAILQRIFIENQVEYVEAIQISGESFFSGVDQVNVLLESTVGEIHDLTSTPTINPEMDNIAEQNKDEDDMMNIPVVFPTAAVESNNSDVASFFTTPVIIGIAVGGAVLCCSFICCLWYCLYFRRRQRNSTEAEQKVANGAGMSSSLNINTPTASKNKPWNRRRNKNNPLDSPVDSMAEQHLMSTDTASNRPDDEASEVASDADTGSMAMYSYNPRGDSGSVYTASNSIMFSGGGGSGSVAINSNYSMYGNDNVSYAYSLEPGIEASIVDGVMMNNTTMNQSSATYDDSVRSRVPIREIPQITLDADKGLAASSKSKGINRKEEGFGDTQIETAASDLKLTPSELAMLPSNLRSDDDEEEIDEADSKGFPSAKKSTTITIIAPSGKLGIVIDTTVDGPVVHMVNPGSRLEGQVIPGDIIVAIDNVDTRAMSASAITTLMVKTAGRQRTLTVRRADTSK
ncbi:hypothetical protein IV203_029285 [Nitzschia inconspicua]|uniref:PDZ domain-containing protein n=1 Tax=Nitzschia inconspicua TaxID=303405 RepID=A0A9K3LRC1_9STRA|nr:hypothetical protein IV203_029285 [Nitzschia inconspicua]